LTPTYQNNLKRLRKNLKRKKNFTTTKTNGGLISSAFSTVPVQKIIKTFLKIYFFIDFFFVIFHYIVFD
jgi:hypothetical protein